MTIYNYDDSRTIGDLLKWNMANPANAPFIKIGKLLLAVDQTGAEAWQPLIRTLNTDYHADAFMLYSGRHGALEGCFHDNGQVPLLVAEKAFYEDDVKEVKRFLKFVNVGITVVNTADLTKDLYKNRVLHDINKHWIIVAWCHSIASMRTIPNSPIQDNSVLVNSAENMTKRAICDIVKDYFDWVPKC